MLWRYEITGVDTLTLHFGDSIQRALADHIHCAVLQLRGQLSTRLIDIVPSYTTILLRYDLLQDDLASLIAAITPVLASIPALPDTTDESQVIEVPVLYDRCVAPDLEAVAHRAGISTDALIHCHSNQIYHVFAIGFAPGFAYLGEVPAQIATPRLATPRAHVPAGSLGIADTQTAIYPLDSPGGWNLIGRTPLVMFDPRRESPSLLEAGQRVRFRPIDTREYLALGGTLDDSATGGAHHG